ncbi:HIT family protein [Synechococcus sp. CBW1107]|uniref:HIT family protein n=2 Tax=unclassified Synechococcus TaxID=2626047 RepID=UPI003A0FCAF9
MREVQAHIFYEDDLHIAFLDIYPITKGQALVIPKKHHSSYVFSMTDQEYLSLMQTSKVVATTIDANLKASRTFMVIEGMEIDHAHIKLYPMYSIRKRTSNEIGEMEYYDGYLSTLHGNRADESTLSYLSKQLKSNFLKR